MRGFGIRPGTLARPRLATRARSTGVSCYSKIKTTKTYDKANREKARRIARARRDQIAKEREEDTGPA